MLRIDFLLALFVCVSARAVDFPLNCTYVANTPTAELEPHARCAALVGTSLRFSAEHLAKMSYTTHGLAEAAIDGSWYYIRPNGESLQVVTLDNGADPFSEGLVRSLVLGKVAYFDSKFHQVIPPRYDWGWPFEAGRAMVCVGCTFVKAGEYDVPNGGKWGFIDKNGKEIVRLTLTSLEAEALLR